MKEIERKYETSTLTREVQKFEITEAEFNTLKPNALKSLTRTSFVVKHSEHLVSIK